MTENQIFALYQQLHVITKLMKVKASVSDWSEFSVLEKNSVEILKSLENVGDLTRLSTNVMKNIKAEIVGILSLQSEINAYASAWRDSTSKQHKSDTMSAKLNNAYS